MMSGKDFLKRHVLKWRWKVYSDWEDVTSSGRVFKVFGPANGKARLPTVNRFTVKFVEFQKVACPLGLRIKFCKVREHLPKHKVRTVRTEQLWFEETLSFTCYVDILFLSRCNHVEQSTKWGGVCSITEYFQRQTGQVQGHHCYSLDPSVFGQRQPVNSQRVTLA